ncbi:hypothetical protein [Rhizomonospora bruguierae]|uniref:hypothetical protein n=1 Tax=Rhizomonospora bruguierae TaxID=1581705 RepID=UPI001BD13793|nr:hypothetical protein [Micromonospora sp. NBRC 107566]
MTAVKPTANTWLTLWPDGYSNYPRPTMSNLNAVKGQTVSNGVLVDIGSGGSFNVYNENGTTDLVVDVTGTFETRVGRSGLFLGPVMWREPAILVPPQVVVITRLVTPPR